MIVRIVKLRFREREVTSFLSNFENVKGKIKNSEGCHLLELLRDQNDPCIFFTHSHWESTEALEGYRNSDLFKGIWAETKTKFDGKPQAWSTSTIEKLI